MTEKVPLSQQMAADPHLKSLHAEARENGSLARFIAGTGTIHPKLLRALEKEAGCKAPAGFSYAPAMTLVAT